MFHPDNPRRLVLVKTSDSALSLPRVPGLPQDWLPSTRHSAKRHSIGREANPVGFARFTAIQENFFDLQAAESHNNTWVTGRKQQTARCHDWNAHDRNMDERSTYVAHTIHHPLPFIPLGAAASSNAVHSAGPGCWAAIYFLGWGPVGGEIRQTETSVARHTAVSGRREVDSDLEDFERLKKTEKGQISSGWRLTT